MNLQTVFQRFPDQEACIEHLEHIRFGAEPFCPLCGSLHVARKTDGDRIGHWTCHACKGSFNVLSGPIFQKTRIPLQKRFLGIGLMVNAYFSDTNSSTGSKSSSIFSALAFSSSFILRASASNSMFFSFAIDAHLDKTAAVSGIA